MDAQTPQNNKLEINSTLGDVPGSEFCVQLSAQIAQVVELFKQHPEISGILIFDNNRLYGIVTRERLFEVLGRPYGNEVFRKKTIREFFVRFGSAPLVMAGTDRIDAVVDLALTRKPADRYSPVVVDCAPNGYRLVDMVTLLTIQNQLLTGLYEKVHELSILDPLTNVYNRRGLLEVCRQRTGWHLGEVQTMSALMVDIDHFKRVNDVFGHLAGDQVLQGVARECAAIIRERDVVVRYGGEEFCILLHQIHLDHAFAIAERIRSRIEEMVFQYDGNEIKVTISIGVASDDLTIDHIDKLISKADQALYQAKDRGRNQVSKHDIMPEARNGTGPMKSGNDLIRDIYEETIWGWVKTLELRDKETEGHARRVADVTVLLAQKLGFTSVELEHIRRGALLHDIGKIAIPDDILFKPGRLSDSEWVVMRQHPIYAYELLNPISFLRPAVDIPYCHHEHWDGSGYPRGLSGTDIPLNARIFTIVDVWDALHSDRRYRAAWHDEQICSYLLEQKGRLFDPELVDLFIQTVYSDALVLPACEQVFVE